MKHRNSYIIKLGRLFQNKYHHLNYLDKCFYRDKVESVPLICILAAPRSGSTLAYQVLCDAFENNHLTNFANLLFATPTLSFKIQSLFDDRIKSSYNSSHGFVSGLFGEAEGLKFWEYWLNQILQETDDLNKNKLSELHSRLKKVNTKPFITGYLGHPFSIDVLRKEFKSILFIHLERDLLANSYSLFNFYGDNNKMLSATPISCKKKEYSNNYERCVDQIITINSIIREQTSDDFINITYEEICINPNSIIAKIQRKAGELGIDLEIKQKIMPFKVSQVVETYDEHTEELYKIIKNK